MRTRQRDAWLTLARAEADKAEDKLDRNQLLRRPRGSFLNPGTLDARTDANRQPDVSFASKRTVAREDPWRDRLLRLPAAAGGDER